MWATHTLFKLPGFNCVSFVASPPLLKYLSTPLVGNPIIKILDTPLFLIPKKGGQMRPVINLKKLNKWVAPQYFKMEGISTTIEGK